MSTCWSWCATSIMNPVRAKLVSNLGELDGYRFCGHGALMGKFRNDWQDTDYVLKRFGKRVGQSCKRYREFVQQGIEQGRRPELVGGGLVRSLGGWKAIKALRGIGERVKGDERILGDGDFVESILRAAMRDWSGEPFCRLWDMILSVWSSEWQCFWKCPTRKSCGKANTPAQLKLAAYFASGQTGSSVSARWNWLGG